MWSHAADSAASRASFSFCCGSQASSCFRVLREKAAGGSSPRGDAVPLCCAGMLGMELYHGATHKCSLLPTQRPQPASVPTKTEINMEPWTQYKKQPKDFHLSLPFLPVSPPRVYFRSPMCQMSLGTRKKLGDLNWPWFHGICNLVRETLATYMMTLATLSRCANSSEENRVVRIRLRPSLGFWQGLLNVPFLT